MRNFLIVLKYTFLENVRKPAFTISTAILVLLTVLIFNIPNIVNVFSSDKNDNSNNNEIREIVIIDQDDSYDKYLNNLKVPNTNYVFIAGVKSDIDNLKKDVSDKKISSIVIIDEKNNFPTFEYIVQDRNYTLRPDAVRDIIKGAYTYVALEKYNVDQSIIVNLNTPITYQVTESGGREVNTSQYVISVIASLLLYFAIYFFGYAVSTSISTEKTSRVMETLITSTKPSSIVLGKTIAMGLLGLGQLLLLIITAILSNKIFVSGDFVLMGSKVDFSSITFPLISLIVLYFILGYFLYAMLNAATGATVTKAEDLSSASMPVSIISLGSFYLGYFSLIDPTSSVNMFASIFPFSSPFTMPCRIISSSVPTWQIILSVLVLIGTIALFAMISIRIYSVAILNYGERIKFKELFRMSKNN